MVMACSVLLLSLVTLALSLLEWRNDCALEAQIQRLEREVPMLERAVSDHVEGSREPRTPLQSLTQ
jgi:hypothetical protein